MANNVALGQSTNVVLPIDYLSIKSSTRKGNDLVVTLVNGEVIILEDYYVKPRKLVSNGTQGAVVQELTVSDEGAITGVRQYSMEQVSEQFGTQTLDLDFQTSDVLLLSEPASTINYSSVLFFGATALIGGAYWYSMEKDKDDSVVDQQTASRSTSVFYDPYTSHVYDSTGKIIKTSFDLDKDGKYDRTESYTWNEDKINTVEYDNNNDNVIDSKITYEYNDTDLQSISIETYNNYIEDFSMWDDARLDTLIGINNIQLSDPNAQTHIILNSQTLSHILDNQDSIIISGDNSDTVTLEQFTKVENSSQTGFEEYSAVIENHTYTAFIDNDVNVILI